MTQRILIEVSGDADLSNLIRALEAVVSVSGLPAEVSCPDYSPDVYGAGSPQGWARLSTLG